MLEEYLVTLPEPVIARLFRSPAACLALLRLLPPLAKALVLRMLFVSTPSPLVQIEEFVRQRRARVDAIQRLRALKIVRERFSASTLELHATFQRSLQIALSCGAANEQFEERGARVPVTELRAFQKQRWEAMLHFMVTSAGDAAEPGMLAAGADAAVPVSNIARGAGARGRLSPAIMALLVKSGLLTRQYHITSDGFQFLLQDQQSQIWALLLHYLNNAAELEMDPVDVLNFLFRLGMLEPGCGYSSERLSTAEQRVLSELAELGIVYVRDGSFYAAMELTNMKQMAAADSVTSGAGAGSTGTAVTTTTSTGGSGGGSSGTTTTTNTTQGFIIVETNYRLYAYTDSPLQISILNLFCSLKSRFANLVIGRFTRHSARRALSNGIKAEQIIQYLTKNQRGGGSLPPTIIDQIKLWQLELDRFRQAPGFLFRDFATPQQYAAAVQFAQDVGALLWSNERTRMFFVDEQSGRAVSEYVNRQMKEARAA